LLRIEDTDRARSTAASEQTILDALHWLGLSWDEGPDCGGPHGPYRQSERLSFYTRYANELLAAGHAFKCFCTPERLDAVRMEQRQMHKPPGYDGHCLALTAAEVAASEAAGVPMVVRMKVPREGSITIEDLLRGPIVFEWRTVDMQVLMKSDGWPTYHLANVVDDHLMKITHVMRGEEWISSAPKHALLYEYFGWEMPRLAHLPLLRNADKSKLSKRKNPTGILFYERMGYLPEALLNFLGLLAGPALDGEEIMDLATMVARFEMEHVSVGGPVFDVAKLDWLNGRYLRERLNPGEFNERVRAWTLNEDYLRRIAPLAQSRIERLSDLGPLLMPFFAGRLDVSAEQLRDGKLSDLELRQALVLVAAGLEALPVWDVKAIEAVIRDSGELLGKKVRDFVRPFYVAINGQAQSVPLFDSMQIVGRDIVRERLRGALERLGGASASEQEAWKKMFVKPATPPQSPEPEA
jgi:glutamyl-tRNA synthetase